MANASHSTVVLAGDIGGTNARLRMARVEGGRLVIVDEQSYRVADFAGLEDALALFVDRVRSSAPAANVRACFAVAGPIARERAKLTNAPWTIDARAIAARFGLARVELVNDFHAAAAGIAEMRPDDMVVLQQGDENADAPRVVMGPGTGLGVAFSIPVGARARIVPGEGGHVGFAPADDEQIELLRFVGASVGRVTAEHLLSGPGIVRIYAFATRSARTGFDIPSDVESDGAAAVAKRAEAGEPQAQRAMAIFAAILGAVAGDYALSVLARGGVYIAGGIAAKLARNLGAGGFIAAFNAKGGHAALMSRIPVRIVVDERLGLAGAARLALGEQP